MNSSRSSKTVGLLAALLAVAIVASAVATPVAATSTSAKGVPSDAKVGSEVTATFTLSELYSDYEAWTLNGQTELKKVTWTVVKYDQAGNQLSKKSYDGQSFNASIDISKDTSEVEVTVKGTVPEVENFSYDDQQTFGVATLSQVRKGGTSDEIDSWSAAHHTEDSKAARDAIASAKETVSSAKESGANTDTAEESLQSAVSAYNGENFELANDLANRAQKEAKDAKNKEQSSQQTQQLLMYGVGAVVLIAIVGGGFYWYSQQGQNTSKLR